MLWMMILGTTYAGGSVIIEGSSHILTVSTHEDPKDLQSLSKGEKEILHLWDETLKEFERISSSPFSLPIPKGDETAPNYEQSSCSANCSAGSCSVSCYGVVICGCTSGGSPVCRCKSSGIVPAGKSQNSHSESKVKVENFKIASLPGGVEVINRSNGEAKEVGVWDVSGRLITRFVLPSKGTRTLHLKRGIYFVKVGSSVKKVVVR